MILDGVNFNERVVSAMTEDQFIERHLPYYWKDSDEKTRRKKLKQAYELIAGKPAKTRKKKNVS